MTPPDAAARDDRDGGFSFASLARVLFVPLVAVAVFLFLFRQPSAGPEAPEGSEGMARVGLVQKDEEFEPIPAHEGGAVGSVWYTPAGEALELQLRAEGLEPDTRYILEIGVDGSIFALGSYAASGDGDLSVDTTLTRFAEGVCVGPNYDPPRELAGEHEIRFWVKRDGNPPDGTGLEHAPGFPEGGALPCRGNGDGDYTYVLLENEVARFTGGPAGVADSAARATS